MVSADEVTRLLKMTCSFFHKIANYKANFEIFNIALRLVYLEQFLVT